MSEEKKCKPFNHPNLVPSWICCVCGKTLNGNNRSECKLCGHTRCDDAPVRRVPIRTETGVQIVPVQMMPDDPSKAN